MTVARPERVDTEMANNVNSNQKFNLDHCECGGEIKVLSTVSGLCLSCGLTWTSASVYLHLYCHDFDDDENDIPL